MPTRQQYMPIMEHVLKSVFDLDEEDRLHIVIHRASNFGIDYFSFEYKEKLKEHEHFVD